MIELEGDWVRLQLIGRERHRPIEKFGVGCCNILHLYFSYYRSPFFRLRSHNIELSELKTEVLFFWDLEHGKTWI